MRAPEDDLALLFEAVQQAGEIALRFWRRKPAHWDKPDNGGPVSEADLAVNDRLESLLRGARPDYGWLSEESPDDPARLTAPRCFIVDPIDGTRAFIGGEDTFSIVAGIAEGDRMVAGAVFLPALDRLYSAHRDGPALHNGTPMQASAASDPDGARVLTTAANMAASHWPGGVPDLKRSFRPSLAYRLCLVGQGRHDAMITFRPCWEWDIAAASLIAAQAGALVTDTQGGPLRFNRAHPQAPGVIAAPPALHGALMARTLLKPV